MKYLDIEEPTLKKNNALFTAKEISGQPELWLSIFNKVVLEKKELSSFIDFTINRITKIILAGAGTSAYIGHSVEGIIQRKNKITTVSVPTTHLVSHPEDYFEKSIPTLLISFARSGNSPESAAAVKFAEKYCEECYHLVITCNSEGNLAKYKFKNKKYIFVLPKEAEDKSLAMTGSYSGMILSSLLINDIQNIDSLHKTVLTLKKYGKLLLSKHLNSIKNVASLQFTRAVFLGSGPQYGTAMESHLKLQELTDGKIICINDTYLGFRHGPKAVVDEKTLVVYYFSNNSKTLLYEKDLVLSMKDGKQPLFQICIVEKDVLNDIFIDKKIVLSNNKDTINEEYLTVSNILLGQLLGFYKSLDMGLKPDSPSISGAISRVVKGVKIY